jgi:hypothetical protein
LVCAIAGAATALAARPTPPAFKKSRRFMCFPSVFPVPDQGTTILSVVSVRPMVDVGLVIETSGPENQANKNQAPEPSS